MHLASTGHPKPFCNPLECLQYLTVPVTRTHTLYMVYFQYEQQRNHVDDDVIPAVKTEPSQQDFNHYILHKDLCNNNNKKPCWILPLC